MKNVQNNMLSASSGIVLWSLIFYIGLHTLFYSIEQLHYHFCTPCGFSGFLQSFFTSRSTMCYALKVASWHTSNASANMMYLILSVIGGALTNGIMNSSKRT